MKNQPIETDAIYIHEQNGIYYECPVFVNSDKEEFIKIDGKFISLSTLNHSDYNFFYGE